MLYMVLMYPTSYHLDRVRPSQDKLTNCVRAKSQKSCLKEYVIMGQKPAWIKAGTAKFLLQYQSWSATMASLKYRPPLPQLEQGLLSSWSLWRPPVPPSQFFLGLVVSVLFPTKGPFLPFPIGGCRVMEQKEVPNGFRDEACGKETPAGYAGLCQ